MTGPLPLHTGDAQSILNYHGPNRRLAGPIRLTDRTDSSTPPAILGVSGRESCDFLGGGEGGRELTAGHVLHCETFEYCNVPATAVFML